MISVRDLVELYGDSGDPQQATDAGISGVLIVESFEDCYAARPGTAVVVASETVFDGGRDLDIVIRIAWERAAACVVVSRRATSFLAAEIGAQLGIPIIKAANSLRDVALDLAGKLAHEEGELRIMHAAVEQFGTGELSAVEVCRRLGTVFPSSKFTVKDQFGRIVAAWPDVTNDTDFRSERFVYERLPFTSAVDEDWALICATPSNEVSPALSAVLPLAVAPLLSWLQRNEVNELRAARASGRLFARLIRQETADSQDEIFALGWPTETGLCLGACLFDGPMDIALLQGRLSRELPDAIKVFSFDKDLLILGGAKLFSESIPIIQGILRQITEGQVKFGFGVATSTSGLSGLGTLLKHARFAARVAQWTSDGFLRYESIDPLSYLSHAVPTDLVEYSIDALAPLLADAHADVLLATLLAVLDHGDRLSDASLKIGVHRNTVAARMERIAALGINIADPKQRLVIHVAAQLLTSRRFSNLDR